MKLLQSILSVRGSNKSLVTGAVIPGVGDVIDGCGGRFVVVTERTERDVPDRPDLVRVELHCVLLRGERDDPLCR